MSADPSPLALGLIVFGALFSLGRDWLSRWTLALFTRLHRGASPDPRLRAALEWYFMLTGMIFTVAGVLGLVGVFAW